ncbi:MAG: hypothetical protein WC637_00420 [Victivallales bacterium]
MSPTIEAPVERICATCAHYGFSLGNPNGWRWTYCAKKHEWFSDSEEKPGERKGCEEWQ